MPRWEATSSRGKGWLSTCWQPSARVQHKQNGGNKLKNILVCILIKYFYSLRFPSAWNAFLVMWAILPSLNFRVNPQVTSSRSLWSYKSKRCRSYFKLFPSPCSVYCNRNYFHVMSSWKLFIAVLSCGFSHWNVNVFLCCFSRSETCEKFNFQRRWRRTLVGTKLGVVWFLDLKGFVMTPGIERKSK